VDRPLDVVQREIEVFLTTILCARPCVGSEHRHWHMERLVVVETTKIRAEDLAVTGVQFATLVSSRKVERRVVTDEPRNFVGVRIVEMR
jgi:hypothetical protein